MMRTSLLRQLFLIALIVLTSFLLFFHLSAYFPAILGSVTLYLILKEWMSKLVRKGWNEYSAAVLLLCFSIVGIVLPAAGIVRMLIRTIGNVAPLAKRIIGKLNAYFFTWDDRFGLDHYEVFSTSELTDRVVNVFETVAVSSPSIFIGVLVMYIILFYLLTNMGGLERFLLEYLPLKRANLKVMGRGIAAIVKSNAVGIPIFALAKALVCLLGFWIFGIDNPFFWFVIVLLTSMVPFLGTIMGVIPIILLSMASGDSFQTWGVLFYVILTIGITDKLVNRVLEKRIKKVHPLTTLLGVIVGLPIFGVMGLIFGPLLINLFFAVLRIYDREFGLGAPQKLNQAPQ